MDEAKFDVIASSSEKQRDAQTLLENITRRKKEQLAILAKELPQELEELIEHADEALLDRLDRLGIKNAKVQESDVYLIDRPSWDTALGHAGPGGIIVLYDIESEKKYFDQDEFFNLLKYKQARTLLHEKYHITGRVRYVEEYGAVPRREKFGLAYINKNFKEGYSFEEGMAVLTEYQLTEEVVDPFFSGSESHYGELVNLLKKDNRFAEKIARDQIPVESVIFDFDENSQLEIKTYYVNSVRLVKYLMEVVPNFEQLAEQARINHKTIALARALKQAFPNAPENVFRMVVSATEETADEILQQLRESQVEKAAP